MTAFQTTGNNAYSPVASVKSGHLIPHLSMKLKLQESTFAITSGSLSTSNPYIRASFTLPAIILAAGILAFIVFGFVLISRTCCNCAKTAPNRNIVNHKSEEDYIAWAKRTILTRNILLVLFSFFLICAFAATQVGWYGNARFGVGMHGIRNRIDLFSSTFDQLSTSGQWLPTVLMIFSSPFLYRASPFHSLILIKPPLFSDCSISRKILTGHLMYWFFLFLYFLHVFWHVATLWFLLLTLALLYYLSAQLFNTTGNSFAQILSTSVCASKRPKDIAAVRSHLNQLSSSGSSIISSASLFSRSLDTFHYQITQYGLTNQNIIFYVFYSVITALCVLLALGVGLRNKVLAQVSFFFTYWLALILSIISCVLMIPVVSQLYTEMQFDAI